MSEMWHFPPQWGGIEKNDDYLYLCKGLFIIGEYYNARKLSMFWQEDIKEEHFTLPDDVQDCAFSIQAKVLPIDHAYLLSAALLGHFPWLDEVGAGVFDISVADGNGWKQDHTAGFYYPSKRSKLNIRVPKAKIDTLQSLVGKTLDLGQYQIKIIKALPPKLMSDMQIVFAKYVACEPQMSEDEFLQTCYNQLQELDITPKKIMAGLQKNIKTPADIIHTRSLMVADLRKAESVRLQEVGIGKYRLLGCGLFVPQKDINSVNAV